MRFASAIFLGLACLVAGCARLPPVDRAALKVESTAALQGHLFEREPDVALFRSRGPFDVAVQKNRELRLSATERVDTDLFLSASAGTVPLVIFVHGHESSKTDHANQAAHLASWGMHCLTVQLSPKGPWDDNGRKLLRIVRLIGGSPQLLDRRVDREKIILVGYSFGGTAVGIALAQGAPAMGAILLDPAVTGKLLPDLLWRVDKPVLVLGSDDDEYATAGREYFYDYIRSDVAELSIRDADHEDAQDPPAAGSKDSGGDVSDRQEFRLAFVSALTSAAMSLSATGRFDYAWDSFTPAFDSGKFFSPKKK